MADLIIVESPSKAKTLKNYLGSGYEVIASKGHVRDLPAAKLSVDVKNDFAPKYSIVKGKEKLVKELKAAVADSDEVYLATDPDREGEAISWHLAEILGLDMEKRNADGAAPVMAQMEAIKAISNRQELSAMVGKMHVEGKTDLKVGDKIVIIPNHSCSSANLTDYYIGVRGEKVEKMITVDMRSNSTKKGI